MDYSSVRIATFHALLDSAYDQLLMPYIFLFVYLKYIKERVRLTKTKVLLHLCTHFVR